MKSTFLPLFAIQGTQHNMGDLIITSHALKQFVIRANALGLNGSQEELARLLSCAGKAPRPKGRSNRLNFLKRRIFHGETRFLVSEGWRFVISNGRLRTSERVKPHENYAERRAVYAAKAA